MTLVKSLRRSFVFPQRVYNFRFASTIHSSKPEEQFNEPTGYLFGRKPGEKIPMDTSDKIFTVMYIGGIAVFIFLYQYKPDTDPQNWARREAQRRMIKRGVDLESYRYKLPQVY